MTLKIKTQQQGTNFNVSNGDRNTFQTDENFEVTISNLSQGDSVTPDLTGGDKVVVITVVELD